MWPWAYSIWQVAGFELDHFVFSFFAAFVVVSPVVYWTWTTYRSRSDGITQSLSNPLRPMISYRAVIYILLLSLSVGLAAHVLEDLYIGWF